MHPSSTPSSLLARVRDPEDRASWHRFDRLYGELILSYCRRRGLQLADAEDVRQTVMLGLVRAMPGFRYDRERGRFRSYVGRAVDNAIRGAGKIRDRRPEPSESGIEPGGDPGSRDEPPDEAWEREWMLHHYRKALRSLRRTFDPRSLAVFEALLTGATLDDQARASGTTADAVRKVRDRVRQRISELIAGQIRDEETGL